MFAKSRDWSMACLARPSVAEPEIHTASPARTPTPEDASSHAHAYRGAYPPVSRGIEVFIFHRTCLRARASRGASEARYKRAARADREVDGPDVGDLGLATW
jgi:hypothetical protein